MHSAVMHAIALKAREEAKNDPRVIKELNYCLKIMEQAAGMGQMGVEFASGAICFPDDDSKCGNIAKAVRDELMSLGYILFPKYNIGTCIVRWEG